MRRSVSEPQCEKRGDHRTGQRDNHRGRQAKSICRPAGRDGQRDAAGNFAESLNESDDGRKLRVRGCDHWEFRGGEVVRKDSYWKIVEQPA